LLQTSFNGCYLQFLYAMSRRGSGVRPCIGPKLLELYERQDQRHARENCNIKHLKAYIEHAGFLTPDSVLRKGRHRQEAGHIDCTSCHFCRQCTEDKKPSCYLCGKCFCAPCLANRFGQNASAMMERSEWTCPVCLDFCNCSGTACRRARLGLEPTASLIFEAQSLGYGSVCSCVDSCFIPSLSTLPCVPSVPICAFRKYTRKYID
jgi:hypothetical protein